MSDVVFYEAFEEEQAVLKKYLPKNLDVRFTEHTIQDSGDDAPPANVVSIRTQSEIPKLWGKTVNGILTRSRGYDHLSRFRSDAGNKIALGYLEPYCSRAVAEQAIMVAMALLRKLKSQIKHFQTFDRNGLTGRQSDGRKVLVAGVGHIGEEIVALARGVGMDVKGFDIDQRLKDLTYVPLKEGVAWAEILICALPLNDQTRDMLNYDVLRQAAPGLIAVNISRGEIMPVEDLKRLLDEGICAGIGMDVFPEEGRLADALRGGDMPPGGQVIEELSQRDDVLFTPHNAFNTREAIERKAQLSAQAVVHFREHGTFPLDVPNS